MHLIVDGYGADPQVLQDEELLYNFLDSYPSAIGMTKVAPPRVFRYTGTKPEDWGLSGFVIIAESHISIHTFVERCYVNIDVFSCREFDPEKVINDLKRLFKLHKIRTYVLKRGLEYISGDKEAEGVEVSAI